MATIHWSGDARGLIVEIPEARNDETHSGHPSALQEAIGALGFRVQRSFTVLTITSEPGDTLRQIDALAILLQRALQRRGLVVE